MLWVWDKTKKQFSLWVNDSQLLQLGEIGLESLGVVFPLERRLSLSLYNYANALVVVVHTTLTM